MIAATRRWFRRNRNGLAIGVGVVGATYLAGHYVLSKISEARERMSSERIAKENLRRRFEQNQTDCTFTVLALLPTVTENVLEALPVENLTHELQQKKADRLAKLGQEGTASEISSGPPSVTDDDGRSLTSFQSESYVHASQVAGSEEQAPKPRKSRAQLWNELKISSMTRSFTLLYTLSLLTLLTRIQLNLLGRRNYLSSVISLASPRSDGSGISLENHDEDTAGQAFGNDFETNRKYLTFSWWLLHRGYKDIMTKVEAAVKEVFGSVNPREDISLTRLSDMTLSVRKLVEGATEEGRRSMKWLPYLLPPRDQESYVLSESGVIPSAQQTTSVSSSTTTTTTSGADPLRRLLDETSDLIDSPNFTHVNTLLLNALFSHLIDSKVASQAFKPASPPPSTQPAPTADPTSPGSLNLPSPLARTGPSLNAIDSAATITPALMGLPDPKSKFANVLAVLTRQAHSIGNGTNPPNEYLGALEEVRELEAFAAVVYSSNFELEGATDVCGNPLTGDGTESTSAPRTGEESLVDLGRESVGKGLESSFEKVWGKTVSGAGPGATG